jgi:hypothetical protein
MFLPTHMTSPFTSGREYFFWTCWKIGFEHQNQSLSGSEKLSPFQGTLGSNEDAK